MATNRREDKDAGNRALRQTHRRGESPGRADFFRRCLVSGAMGILLIALYSIIFQFSAQNAEQSGSLSLAISERCAKIINALSGGGWSEAKLAGMAEYFEHPIRKLAHFSEYACMGVLVYVLWSQWMKQGRRLYLLTVLWVFLSAAYDEFHQYFVPGRYASVADVLLDTSGGAFGMLFCICAAALYRKHQMRKAGKGKDRKGKKR